MTAAGIAVEARRLAAARTAIDQVRIEITFARDDVANADARRGACASGD